MNKPGPSLATRFGPERKTWIRTLDAIVVLMAPACIAGAIFVFQIEIPLLKAAFFGGLVCTPIVAWTLYRESNLSRLERIALLLLVLCLSLALMVAAIESKQTP
jgi:flagellar biosynthesis protein FliQ